MQVILMRKIKVLVVVSQAFTLLFCGTPAVTDASDAMELHMKSIVQLSDADCNYALNQLVKYNKSDKPDGRTSFAEKATFAYAAECQRVGLISIPMYLYPAPVDASPEVQKYCSQHARTPGEAEECLITGKVDN